MASTAPDSEPRRVWTLLRGDSVGPFTWWPVVEVPPLTHPDWWFEGIGLSSRG